MLWAPEVGSICFCTSLCRLLLLAVHLKNVGSYDTLYYDHSARQMSNGIANITLLCRNMVLFVFRIIVLLLVHMLLCSSPIASTFL